MCGSKSKFAPEMDLSSSTLSAAIIVNRSHAKNIKGVEIEIPTLPTILIL